MSADEEEARERLLFHLENQTGFWFALVVGDDPRPRARVREAAEAWCKENGRPFFLHEPDPEGLVKLAVSLAKGDAPGIHWIRADGVTGLGESWRAGAAQMLMAMNERREAYRKRLEGGIVVEGRLSLKRILREMAPDLFSIRAFIAEPGEEPKTRIGEAPEWRPPAALAAASGFAPDSELALEQLARVKAFEGRGGAEARIEALLLATASLVNSRRFDEAEYHATHALNEIEQYLHNPGGGDWVQWVSGALHGLLGTLAAAKGDRGAKLRFSRALNYLNACQAGDGLHDATRTLALIFMGKQEAMALVYSGDLGGARDALNAHFVALTRIPKDALSAELKLELLDTCVQLGNVLRRLSDLVDAEVTLRAAVQLADVFLFENPGEARWRLELIGARVALGRVLVIKNDMGAALEALKPAVEIVKSLEDLERMKGKWREEFEDLYVLIGMVLWRLRDFTGSALPILERAIAHVCTRFESAPDDVDLGWLLANLYIYHAVLFEKGGNVNGARTAMLHASRLVAQLPAESDNQAHLKETLRLLGPSLRKKHTRQRAPQRS